MTITINHPQSGRVQGHNRLIVAAIGVALVVSLAIAVQVTNSDSATQSTRSAATDQVVDVDQARSAETSRLTAINDIPLNPTVPRVDAQTAETARLTAINDIPWNPTVPRVDAQAIETARLTAINDIPWNPTVPRVDAQTAETARLTAINDIPWSPTTSVAVAQADLSGQAFFLSINDATELSTLGATTADGDLAFLLSINDVDS